MSKDKTERNQKVKEYIKSLKEGDKVQFCGTYGGKNTFFYVGSYNKIAYFSHHPVGAGLPLDKWKKNILLPEEWGEEIQVPNPKRRNFRDALKEQ